MTTDIRLAPILLLTVTASCIGIYTDPQHHVDGGAGNADASPDGNADAQTGTGVIGNRIFVTSSTYQGGKLGGLDGADATCQTAAASAQLPGTYRAWLSTDTDSPLTRLTHATSSYTLVDGTVLAQNWDDLVDGQIDHAIDLNQDGTIHTADPTCMAMIAVWSNTGFDGAELPAGGFHDSCNGWTDLSADGDLGNVEQHDPQWTDSGCSVPCTGLAALYCVEQ